MTIAMRQGRSTTATVKQLLLAISHALPAPIKCVMSAYVPKQSATCLREQVQHELFSLQGPRTSFKRGVR
jgi:hypothetical protein